MTEYSHKEFLKDKDFITWCLTGDPHLDVFWREYIDSHPEQRESFEKAIREFSKIKLNQDQLTESEENLLLDRIHLSTRKAIRKRLFIHLSQYAAVACILIATGLFIFHKYETQPETTSILSQSLPVKEDFDKDDICLITDSKTTSFAQDVKVQVNESGSAIVQEAGGKSTVVETGKTIMNKLIVPYGKRSQLVLSDGSEVWVNSGSVLEFPSTFNGDTRSINLTGEMFIHVAKNQKKPFFVNTPDFQVKVYGTQFNISAYQDNAVQSIVLVSGSVGIKSTNQKETFLQPNEMLIYKEQEIEKKQVDVTQYISWKDGYIVMDQTPISYVLKLIERYYNQSFVIRDNVNLGSRTCTGKLYLSDNIDNVMKTISILSSIEYKQDGKTIYITIHPQKEMPMKHD